METNKDSKHEIGLRRLHDILGKDFQKNLDYFNSISPDFTNYIIEFAYGDLYARKGLTDKTLEVAAVACLIGQGNTGLPLKAHLKGMLNVGWTPKEVLELIIYMIGYSGFPSAVEALICAKEIIEEYKKNNI